MNQKEILKKLRQIKPELEKKGFRIIGLFGSYARGDAIEGSDIDILYDIEPSFLSDVEGFGAFDKLRKIKEQLIAFFGIQVDITSADNHSKTFRNHALKDVIYV